MKRSVRLLSDFLSRSIRLPLRAIPRERPRSILTGPLRGARWIPGSSTHGCWLGSYERKTQEVFSELVLPGHVVFDIGANVGFFTLLSARLCGPTGAVVAFEPFPRNLGCLRKHIALNDLSNVTVVEAAVSDSCGGATSVLSVSRPTIILSCHGWRQHAFCTHLLEELGYRISLQRDGTADGNYEVVATPA